MIEARPRILIAEPERFSLRAVRLLEEAADVELRATARDALGAAFAEYDVVWLRLAHVIDADLLPAAPRCRIIATPVTGLDRIDLEACAARGLRVVSLRGETEFLREVRATAEHTLALLLALLRRIPAATTAVRQGVWDRDLFPGGELYGKTAGIVGMGRLGTIVAGYLRALGMRVVGYDPRVDYPEDAAERVESLEALARVSDIVSIHASYTEQTRGLLGREFFSALKPGAVLVNTARGGILDEAALLDSLRSGQLAGAALDVLDGEPHIGPSHPVVAYAASHESLIVTPHIGGNTPESFEKTEVFLAERVREALLEIAR